MTGTPRTQHRARKRFGQNFLVDDYVVQRIVAAIAARDDQHLVEIGPGQGVLTGPLLESGCRLDVVELDRDLIAGLLAAFVRNPRFTLHQGDALRFEFDTLGEPATRLRIVGNLPYNISTPLIFKLLQHTDRVQDMHFMLQREVVDRLAATPGNKLWGRLGIMAQYHCRVEHLFDVPPDAFRPAPKVWSAVVRLAPHRASPWPDCNEHALRDVVRSAFAQRRKTLRNNLKAIISGRQLEALGIDPGARAETLKLTQFIEIANARHEQSTV